MNFVIFVNREHQLKTVCTVQELNQIDSFILQMGGGGDEGTSYVEHESRIQGENMRKIANEYLKKVGKRLIKSKETCRSWGKCRNKRSRQVRQHRGRNLWSYLKPQKNLRSRHINVHYNRAHIKNYTRFAFGNMALKHLVCRRAMDDKACIRCGTSEGFFIDQYRWWENMVRYHHLTTLTQ